MSLSANSHRSSPGHPPAHPPRPLAGPVAGARAGVGPGAGCFGEDGSVFDIQISHNIFNAEDY